MRERILRTLFFLVAAPTLSTGLWAVQEPPRITASAVRQMDVLVGTKTVAGTFSLGGTITCTVTLTRAGFGPQADNPGNEFTDTLPASLTVGAVSASSGTVSANGVNPVIWNGSIPALSDLGLAVLFLALAGAALLLLRRRRTACCGRA